MHVLSFSLQRAQSAAAINKKRYGRSHHLSWWHWSLDPVSGFWGTGKDRWVVRCAEAHLRLGFHAGWKQLLSSRCFGLPVCPPLPTLRIAWHSFLFLLHGRSLLLSVPFVLLFDPPYSDFAFSLAGLSCLFCFSGSVSSSCPPVQKHQGWGLGSLWHSAPVFKGAGWLSGPPRQPRRPPLTASSACHLLDVCYLLCTLLICETWHLKRIALFFTNHSPSPPPHFYLFSCLLSSSLCPAPSQAAAVFHQITFNRMLFSHIFLFRSCYCYHSDFKLFLLP